MRVDFETFMPMGSKEAKMAKGGEGKAIFGLYLWVLLQTGMFWATHLIAICCKSEYADLSKFTAGPLTVREGKIPTPSLKVSLKRTTHASNTRQVKASLKKLELSNYEDSHLRTSLYRPFSQRYLYFDNFWNEERYQQYRIFPTPETENENHLISLLIEVLRSPSWFL